MKSSAKVGRDHAGSTMTAASFLRSFPAGCHHSFQSVVRQAGASVEWDEEGLEIVRRNVSEDSTGSISDNMKNVEMTESRRPPEGRRAPLLGLPGGPTGRVTLPVRLGYHPDNRCRMRMEHLAMRISWKRGGLQDTTSWLRQRLSRKLALGRCLAVA